MDYLNKYIGSTTRLNSRKWGGLEFEVISITPAIDGDLVVKFGNPNINDNPLVRIHSECIFAEIFDSDFCDCSDQFQIAMKMLNEEQNGFLFYLRFDGRGAGLAAKVKATELEMNGTDTFNSRVAIGVEPESRNFKKIGEYLKSKGFTKIRLLTNNPNKVADIADSGIIVTPIPLLIDIPNDNVRKLYHTKAEFFNHKIPKNLQ